MVIKTSVAKADADSLQKQLEAGGWCCWRQAFMHELLCSSRCPSTQGYALQHRFSAPHCSYMRACMSITHVPATVNVLSSINPICIVH